MADTFDKRMAELAKKVGDGDLTGSVVFDQAYAQYQHETPELKHPRGGGPYYLSGALQAKYQRYYQALANDVLEGDLTRSMIDVAEDLAGESARRAPVEEGTLRASASPRVEDNGHEAYSRPGAPREER